jgi:uncharacterized membrane protein
MKRKKLLIILAVVTLIVLLLAGLAGAAIVFAQDSLPMRFAFFGWHGGDGEGFGPGGGFGWMHESSVCDAVTVTLGLTHEELVAELRAGKSLTEIAEEQGVEMDTVNEAVSAAVEQAVEDGTLTREQADWLLERLEQGLGFGWGRGGYSGGEGECSCGSHE